MECFPYGTLIAFSEGALDPSERQAVLDHLAAGCRHCREETELLQEILAQMRADKSPEVPFAALQAALGLFDRIRKSTPAERVKHKITAWLAFDSFQQPAMAGIRNVKGLGKQLLYKAEGYDVDIRFSPTGRAEFENLIGQVLQRETAAGVADAVVALATEGHEVLTATTDALGIFSFRDLPRQRRYDFQIMLPDAEITIGDVSPS